MGFIFCSPCTVKLWGEQNKLARYRVLNQFVKKGEILFAGSSLMEQFPINELLMSNGMTQVIYSRGIGDFTIDVSDGLRNENGKENLIL